MERGMSPECRCVGCRIMRYVPGELWMLLAGIAAAAAGILVAADRSMGKSL